jgi:hypothetical protein
MRIFLLAVIALLLVSPSDGAQVVTENSSIVVLNSGWSKFRRKVEAADVPTNTPAQSVMNRTNRNFERNRRVNDMPGTPDPNEGTVEARSAALDKTMQESRDPNAKTVDGYLYEAKIRNTFQKTIEVLFWEYEFTERANPSNVTSHQFLCGVKIKPNKEQDLSVFTTSSPGNSVSAANLPDNKTGSLFEERIVINRVEYADGTILQRQDWNYGKIKKSLDNLLSAPWGKDVCRNL